MNLLFHSARQVASTWRLIFSDRAALLKMDRTSQAFWRSFWAFVPSTLFFQLVVNSLIADTGAVRLTTVLAFVAVAALPWVLWPLIAFYLLNALGLGARYLDYVIVTNWTSLIPMPFTFGFLALVLAFKGSALIVLLLSSGFLTLLFFIWWRATLRSLGCEPVRAIGVLAAQVGLAIVVAIIQQAALAFVGK